MKLRKCLLTLILCIFCVTEIYGYNIRRISSKDGLTSSYILSLGQTPEGLMMIGAVDGLNIYDGNKIWNVGTTYRDFLGNIIEDIATVNDGNVWALTNHGLNIINIKNAEVEHFTQFKGLRQIRTNEVGEAFLLDDGLIHYRDVKGVFQQLKVPDVSIDSVCNFTIVDNYIYVFHRRGILRYELRRSGDGYEIGQMKVLDDAPIQTAHGNAGSIYLTDENDVLYRYDLKTNYKRPIISLSDETLHRGIVRDVLEFKGKLFIAFANHGIETLDIQKNDNVLTDLGINTGVFRLMKDRLGDIVWIATDGQGVYMYCEEQYAQRSFTTDKLNMGLSCPVRSVLRDESGVIWLGTKGDGLIVLPDGISTTREKVKLANEDNSNLSSNVVYCLARSSKKGFWICNSKGLDFCTGKVEGIKRINIGTLIREVVAAQEVDNQLWITTLGYGVFCAEVTYNGDYPELKNFRQYSVDGGKLSSNYFFCLAQDKEGKWWFGNRGKGLFKLEGGQLVNVPLDSAVSVNPLINDVYALLPLGDDIWAGTGCGVVIRAADGSQKVIDNQDGLPNNTIHGLLHGVEEDIWVTTNGGMVVLSPEAEVLKVFGKKGDLEIIEYSDGAVSLDGNSMFFGGTNGFTSFERDIRVRPQTHPSQLVFTSLSIEGEPFNINKLTNSNGDDRTLILSPQQRSFSIGVSSMDYLVESFNNYYYRLSSSDAWIDNGQDNTFIFTQLSYGSHTLYIKYKNQSNGVESPEFKLNVIISPPWYRSTLAYIIYILLIISAIYIMILYWIKRQRERQTIEIERQNQVNRDRLYEEKMQFLTNVVHELNTPLTLIYGPCERILGHEPENAFVKKYVQQIVRNLQRLNMLIQEIIDFRRVTTGHHVIQIRRVDMTSMMESFVDSFRELADRYKIEYQAEIKKDVIWNSDEKALARIVRNLISNAFKYTKPGGNINVGMNVENEHVVITVYNTGAGISVEDQKRIFDYYSVFNNAEESITGEQTSRNGIGMAICHNMVRLLGGNIQIKSEVGKYAQFIVSLPTQQLPDGVPADQEPVRSDVLLQQSIFPVEATTQVAVEKTSHVRPKHLTGETAPTVLVIDDHQEILDLVCDGLEGYHLLTAHNGDEGFARMKDEQPDLIITDLMMPGTDGLDFIQQVKQNRHTTHIPLIILSAKSSEEERIEGLESGADVYISKPFSIAYLQATVSRLIENRNMLREYYNSGASAHQYSAGKLISKEDQQFVENVVKVMDDNLSNSELSPEILAKILGISLRNLYRKFEAAQLPTPKEYIKAYKINAAARMLTTSGNTVQEIIYATGYNTRSLFYAEFKKHFGVTPKEYREQHQFKEGELE